MRDRDEPLERDVLMGRIKVEVNGLEPLEMRLPILFPSGDTTSVELEYENLSEHCFACLSLFHEEKQCHLSRSPSKAPLHRFGISQQNTLNRIERDKKRLDWRRASREEPSSYRGREVRERSPERHSSLNRRNRFPKEDYRRSTSSWDIWREVPRQKDRYPSHRGSHSHSTVGYKDADPNLEYSRSSLYSRKEYNQHDLHMTSARTPSPRTQREPIITVGAAETGEITSSQRERRPALERLSQAEPPLILQNSASERLQEVQIQVVDDDHQSCFYLNRLFEEEGLIPTPTLNQEAVSTRGLVETRWPCRSIMETRGHIFRRLGPITVVGVGSRMSKRILNKSATLKIDKRKTTRNLSKKKGTHSPLKGLIARKRNDLKTNASPRKRRRDGQAGPSSTKHLNNEDGAAPTGEPSSVPAMVLIPSLSGGVVDLRGPPNPLP